MTNERGVYPSCDIPANDGLLIDRGESQFLANLPYKNQRAGAKPELISNRCIRRVRKRKPQSRGRAAMHTTASLLKRGGRNFQDRSTAPEIHHINIFAIITERNDRVCAVLLTS